MCVLRSNEQKTSQEVIIGGGYEETKRRSFLGMSFVKAALVWCALCCGALPVLYAQLDYVYIDSISIKGNHVTKASIIFREISFAPGDTILLEELPAAIELSELFIMNTGLFNCATITYKNWEGATNKIHLQVDVDEAWYIFPVPVFDLADRNFNVWWVEQGRSLDRIDFGVDFSHLNITGHMDRLKFSAKYGYTRRYALSYRLPYFNKAHTLGFSAEAAFLQNREINHITLDNKQVFYRDESQFLYQRFRAGIELNYRPRLKSFHNLTLGYRQNRVAPEVASELNPDFLGDGRTLQRYFLMSYRYVYDSRDVRAYPWRGTRFYGSLQKDGFGFFTDRNALTAYAGLSRYIPIGQRSSLAVEAHGKRSLIREPQPYNDNRAIGFGPIYLHGFEYYIVDGLDYAIFRSAWRYRFLDLNLHFGKVMPIHAFRNMPIRLNVALNNDLGYAHEPGARQLNPLNNRLLWGGGLGLEVVLYYDKVIRIEYSINDLMEKGIFLHLNMNI
jgi:hypothetical protein